MKKRDGRLRRRIDSVLQAGMGKQILALLACNAVFFALFLFLCGELGYGLAVGGGGEAAGAAADSLSAADRLWFLYNNYIDTGNQVGVPRKERWAALLISLFGSVFVSGLLISTLSNIIERRVERCRSGRVHYRMRDHYVLIGTDAMLPGLILQLFGRDRKCQVVVQTIKDVEEVRRKLFSHLPHAYERRIAFCYARRDSLEELETSLFENDRDRDIGIQIRLLRKQYLLMKQTVYRKGVALDNFRMSKDAPTRKSVSGMAI